MARMPNTVTKAERVEIHKAKMAGKKFDRERRYEARQREIAAGKARLAEMIAQMKAAEGIAA